MTPVIVRADDAASCREANRAIAECADAGVVKCVSVLAVAPDLADAARLLAHRADIEIGFHFALNAEWEAVPWGSVAPPDTVPSLLGANGYFRPMPKDVHAHGFVVAEALTEARAQLVRLREVGFRPTYLDEHCHVSWISEELENGLAELAQTEGLLYVKHHPTLPVSYALRYFDESAPDDPPTVLRDPTAMPLEWVTHPGRDETGGTMHRFYGRTKL